MGPILGHELTDLIATLENVRDNLDAPYGLFKDYPGDKLAGHEVLQHAWLKVHGLVEGARGVGAVSANNPAVALGKKMHAKVYEEQKLLGLFDRKVLRTLSDRQVIQRNALAMKRAGVPQDVIGQLQKEAVKHAATLPK